MESENKEQTEEIFVNQEKIKEDEEMYALVKQMDNLVILNNENEIGYCFDEKMLLHKDFSYIHWEKPERAMSIYLNIINKGLDKKLKRIACSEISEDLILTVHTKEYLDTVKSLENIEFKEKNEYKLCHDTYNNYYTYLSAKYSAGGLMKCVEAVENKLINGCFAIVRPPGHHSFSDKCEGFCFFNNVAIAAKYLQSKNKKVAIVDWDVHHGNGTQELFYKENLLFISLHRYDKTNFYPYKSSANYTNIGKDEGEGFNLNIPWNTLRFKGKNFSTVSDAEYISAFELIIKPVLNEYKPDVILVSSGFDAAEEDPLGRLSVTPFGYYYMTYELKKIAPTIVALEGGYNLKSLADCSEAVIRALLGQDFKDLLFRDEIFSKMVKFSSKDHKNFFEEALDPNISFIEDLVSFRKHFSKYWKCLHSNDSLSNSFEERIVNKLTKIALTIYPSHENLLQFTVDSFTWSKINIDSDNYQEHLELLKYIQFTKQTTSLTNGFRLTAASLIKDFNENQSINIKEQYMFDTIIKFLNSFGMTKEDLIKSLSKLKEIPIEFLSFNLVIKIIDLNSNTEKENSMKSKLRSSKIEKNNVIEVEIFENSINQYLKKISVDAIPSSEMIDKIVNELNEKILN